MKIMNRIRVAWAALTGRAYDVARLGRHNSDWVDSRNDANRENRDALEVARSAARDADRNNGLFRRILSMYEGGIVGRGFQLQSMPKQRRGKDFGQVDAIASDMIERNFRAWANKAVSADGRMSLAAFCRHIVITRWRDGEVFVRPLVIDGELRLQSIEGDYVPVHLTDNVPVTADGRTSRKTVNGVAIDEYGRPVAFYMAKEHPGENGWGYTRVSPETTPVPASNVLHYFKPERPGQVRGMPPLSAVMNDLRMLKKYESAELAAARANAARPVSIERDPEAEVPYTGDSKGADGQNQINLGENGVSILPMGYTMKWSPVQHPAGNFAPFVNQITRRIAAAANLSHALLTRNLSEVNFSSLKVESTDCARFFAMAQDELVDQVLMPVFLLWLKLELTADRLASGKIKLSFVNFEKYKDARFIPPPFPSWDPLKDLQADLLAARSGLTSMQAISFARYGMELQDTLREREQEREWYADAGLPDVLEMDSDGVQSINPDEAQGASPENAEGPPKDAEAEASAPAKEPKE